MDIATLGNAVEFYEDEQIIVVAPEDLEIETQVETTAASSGTPQYYAPAPVAYMSESLSYDEKLDTIIELQTYQMAFQLFLVVVVLALYAYKFIRIFI